MFFVLFVTLIIYDMNAKRSIITVPSNLWMIFSIISIIITSISLCLILSLTEEDRKQWYGTNAMLENEMNESRNQGGGNYET